MNHVLPQHKQRYDASSTNPAAWIGPEVPSAGPFSCCRADANERVEVANIPTQTLGQAMCSFCKQALESTFRGDDSG
ncbi:hypothetical protein TgHK011_003354 [Trichoderma gracile]|nr:hypothetical protein TgHK011_003354 [Trichoderma gracile]